MYACIRVGYNTDRIENVGRALSVPMRVNAESLYRRWLTPGLRRGARSPWKRGQHRSLALLTCFHRADTQTLLFHLTMWLVRRVLRPHCSCAELSRTLRLLFTIQLPFYSSICILQYFPTWRIEFSIVGRHKIRFLLVFIISENVGC